MSALYRSNKILELREGLANYERQFGILPGIVAASHRKTLLEQVLDSVRRVEYVYHIRDADHNDKRLVPGSGLFDPLKAAAVHSRRGNLDEAYWLTTVGD
jgi:hypothetical protein